MWNQSTWLRTVTLLLFVVTLGLLFSAFHSRAQDDDEAVVAATPTSLPSELPKLDTPDLVFDSVSARVCWDLIPGAPEKNNYRFFTFPINEDTKHEEPLVKESTQNGVQFCLQLGEGYVNGDVVKVRAYNPSSHQNSDWGEVTVSGLAARLAEPPNPRWEPDKFSWGKVEGAPDASDYLVVGTVGTSDTGREPSYFAATPPSPDYGFVYCNDKPAGEGGECWILWHNVDIDMQLSVQACANGFKNGYECNEYPSNSPIVSIYADERSLPPLPGCEADYALITIEKTYEHREHASKLLICNILRFRICVREEYIDLTHAGLINLARKTDSFIGGRIDHLISQLHDDLQDWKNDKLAKKELSSIGDVIMPRDGNFISQRNVFQCVNTNATPWPAVEFNSNVLDSNDFYYFDGTHATIGWRSVVPEIHVNETVYSPRHFGIEIRAGSGETTGTFYVNEDPDSPDILFPFAAEPNERYEIQVWADEETDEARKRIRAVSLNLLPVMEYVLPASTPNALHITINQFRGATYTPTPTP